MSSGSRDAIVIALLLCTSLPLAARELRVCADPDNLPLSHEDGRGYENRIADVIAQEMGATLRFEWTPLRRGFVRKTLGAGLCDVVIGVPEDWERVTTTRAYYRSSYVFVDGRAAAGVETLDDPRLAQLRIGVQLVGNDVAATPAGHALASRGHVDNVRGYTVYGDGSAAQRIVAAVADGALDAALVWGPQAGYFVARAGPGLDVRCVKDRRAADDLPLEFAIAIGVARGNTALRDELDAIVARRRADIDAILAEYHVPCARSMASEAP
jgi:quinoprotein dehydrogenase-associated probable ABC transporter substrate-binding protein